MKVLITGIAGFVGSYLAEECLKHGAEVHGLERPEMHHGHLEGILDKITIHNVDMRDGAALSALLAKTLPDRIFHLAAQSYVPLSWNSPADTYITNVIGQVNLFEGVRQLGLKPRVLITGSSEEYGIVAPNEVPIRETNLLRPTSPYAVSKVTQDLMGYQYFKSHGVHAIRTRAFNHTGPRRNDLFVISGFCAQVARIEAGQKEPVLLVGNLEAVRDFSDVRDVVRAYWLALEKGEAGEVYNISSGEGRKIADILQIILKKSKTRIEVKQDPARLRPADLPIIIGDSAKFRSKTGWKPEIPFEKTLEDLLEYWRAAVKAGR